MVSLLELLFALLRLPSTDMGGLAEAGDSATHRQITELLSFGLSNKPKESSTHSH